MSEYTTRPSVRTVAASPQNTDSGNGATAAGIVLAGTAVVALLRAAGQAWAATRMTGTGGAAAPPLTSVLIQSPAALREQFSIEERQAAAALLAGPHTRAEALKMATAAALERTPFHAIGTSLDAPVAALAAARDIAEVEQARARLLEAIERDHLGVFVQRVSEAAATASREAGFVDVEVTRSADGASARVIATDKAGRCLVSEVTPDAMGQVSLATEAVGITDGSCHTALNNFNTALERLGLQSGRPERTTTGGVCELAFAREFLRSRGRAPVRHPAPTGSSEASIELSRRRAQNRRPDRTRTNS
jgi:hypothetical protein